LVGDRPPGTFFIGLSSIHWREAWKYGERAYRYCQHDLGHAIAALSLSAAGQGWRLVLLDELSTDYVAALLGLVGQDQPDAEHPDCLLAVEPQGPTFSGWGLPSDAIGALAQGEFQRLDWRGEPNSLSPSYVDWPAIQTVAEAAWKGRRKPSSVEISYPGCDGQSWTQIAELSQTSEMQPAGVAPGDGATLRQIVRRRRSAVRMDGSTTISLPAFYRLLQRTLPLPGAFPFNALPWEPQVHLAIFVHLVDGLQPGLYLLVRHPREEERLRGALSAEFAWEKPVDCPPELSFSLLAAGDARGLAQQLSCQQSIAGMGCFSLGLLAAFEAPLRQYGPWFYPRLFWECGMIGQVLYLEAEAAGLRGTGIGCFFDDAVHQVLGLSGWEYQSLYHFAVGGSVDDPRLATLPAYP
jgi:nitroreductase